MIKNPQKILFHLTEIATEKSANSQNFCTLFPSLSRPFSVISSRTHNISRQKLYKCIKYLVDESGKISSSLFTENFLSHEILLMLICWIYPMIATTVYIVPDFICLLWDEPERRHTHSDENSIMLCAAASLSSPAVFIIVEFLSLRDIHMEHRAQQGRKKKNCMMVKKYPPRDNSAHLQAHNVHPLMRSSVQIHIYAVVDHTTYSMFRFSLLTVW